MSVQSTIHQLLAIAEDQGASPAERELAMQRATTLMARHSITSLNPQTSRTEKVTTRTITVPGGPTTASLALAYGIHAVATAAGASTYYTDRRRWRRNSDGHGPAIDVHLVGYPADLEWLTALSSSLITHAALGWATWRRRPHPRRQGGHRPRAAGSRRHHHSPRPTRPGSPHPGPPGHPRPDHQRHPQQRHPRRQRRPNRRLELRPRPTRSPHHPRQQPPHHPLTINPRRY